MPSGYKSFSVSEVLTAADVNNYLMEQSICVFANATARDAAITSPENGMAAFLLDSNSLMFYYSSAWNSFIGAGDITGVTITTSSTSGLEGGATPTSGAFSSTLGVKPHLATSATAATDDTLLISDTDDSNNLKKVTVQSVLDAGGFADIGLVIALG